MNLDFLKTLNQKVHSKLIENLSIVRDTLRTESVETTTMLKTYLDYSQGKVGSEEMKEANIQFRSVLKTLGLGTLAVLPLSPLTIPLIVKLGDKLGVDVLPKSIREKMPK